MAEAGTKQEFKASARGVRMSARKARLVLDAVRGRNVEEAIVLLQFVNRRPAPAIRKLIQPAVANAEDYGNRAGVDIDTTELVIADATADEGPRMKRWRPRSRGMATPFTKYTCHLHVTVAGREWVEKRAEGRPAWARPRKRLSKEQRLAKREAKAAGVAVTAPAKPAKKEAAKAAKPAAEKAAKPAKAAKAEAKPAAESKPKAKAKKKD